MRRSAPKIAPLFVVLLAAWLAFPGIFNFHRNRVSAFAQDTSRSDVKSTVKPPRHSPKMVNGDAPANDNCANAMAVVSCPFTDTRDTAGATEETGEPVPCAPNEATIWYTYTNTSSNPVILTVTLCNSDFDAV